MRRPTQLFALSILAAMIGLAPALAGGAAPVPPMKPLGKAKAFSEAVAAANAAVNTAGGGATVTVNEGDSSVASAAPVYLAIGNLSCAHSVGAGVQTHSVGVSFGATLEDPKCDMRQDALVLRQMDQHAAALMRLCMDDDMRLAYAMAGVTCPKVPYSLVASRSTSPPETPAE